MLVFGLSISSCFILYTLLYTGIWKQWKHYMTELPFPQNFVCMQQVVSNSLFCILNTVHKVFMNTEAMHESPSDSDARWYFLTGGDVSRPSSNSGLYPRYFLEILCAALGNYTSLSPLSRAPKVIYIDIWCEAFSPRGPSVRRRFPLLSVLRPLRPGAVLFWKSVSCWKRTLFNNWSL